MWTLMIYSFTVEENISLMWYLYLSLVLHWGLADLVKPFLKHAVQTLIHPFTVPLVVSDLILLRPLTTPPCHMKKRTDEKPNKTFDTF